MFGLSGTELVIILGLALLLLGPQKLPSLARSVGKALRDVRRATDDNPGHSGCCGTAGFRYAFPIACAVTVLLAIVTISYQQTIHAYPAEAAPTSWPETISARFLPRPPVPPADGLCAFGAVAVSSGVAQIVSAFRASPLSRSAGGRLDRRDHAR